MVGHRIMGISLVHAGDIAESRGHLDQAIALYDPAEHRPLATRFGQDVGVAILSSRSWALWPLGYPEAALRDADDALRNTREIGQAATLMYALFCASMPYTLCGNRAAAAAHARELVALAEEKGSPSWQAYGMMNQGCVLALTGRASDVIEMLISGIAARRTTGATLYLPFYLPHLAHAHADLGQFEAAWRCIGEATTAAETTNEKWCESEIHRTAGEIALMSPGPDAAKAQAHFERAIAIARAQKAKSWELRGATSLGRLRRNQRPLCRSPRPARAPIRLVHRRLRHTRSQRRESAPRLHRYSSRNVRIESQSQRRRHRRPTRGRPILIYDERDRFGQFGRRRGGRPGWAQRGLPDN